MSSKTKPQIKTKRTAAAEEWPEVLTLAEAAEYLRVSEEDVLRLVGPRGLPGRLIGDQWRFHKDALEDWLCTPPKPSSKEALLSMAGAWKDDPFVEEIVEEAYKRRGRPMVEGEE